MRTFDFSKKAREYDRIIREGFFLRNFHDYCLRKRAKKIIKLLSGYFGGTSELVCLDVGCGIGEMEKLIEPHFKRVIGIDPAAEMIKKATSLGLKKTKFLISKGEKLNFKNNYFDVAIISSVLHHIKKAAWQKIFSEINRVLKNNGLLIVVEHNKLNPLTRLVFKHSVIDKGAELTEAKDAIKYLTSNNFKLLRKSYLLFFGQYLLIAKKASILKNL